MGDLGRLFPSDDRTPRAVDSSRLLREVVERLAAAGLRPASIDVTVIGARPRLGSRLDAMRAAIAATVGLDGRARQREGLDRQPRRATRARDGRSRPAPSRRSTGAGMTISLQDTLTGEVRPLEPIEPGHVGVYSCGPTVYGPAHIGNFRSFLFADLLVRYLR